MKLHYNAIISLLCVLFLGLSCAKEELSVPQDGQQSEEEQESDITPDPDKVILEISFEESSEVSSRIAFSGKGSLSWEIGDKVAVWDGYELRQFTVRMMEDKAVLEGTAVAGVKYWAVYPYDACKGVDTKNKDNPVFDVEIPSAQVLRKGSIPAGALCCIGKGTKESGIVLKHISGILSFTFPNAETADGKTISGLKPGSLNHIEFRSVGGAHVSGTASVSLNGDVPDISTEGKSGASVIDLSFESLPEAGASYSFCTFPCELGGAGGGISLSFSRSEDKAVAEITGGGSGSIPIARAKSQSLGEIWPMWHAADDSAFDDSANPVGSYDYSVLAKMSHPRILATDEDFRALKALLESGSYPELNRQHQNVLDHAEGLLSKTVPNIDELDAMVDAEKGSYQNVFNSNFARPVVDHLFNCSYAYRLTGDERYLDHVKSLIALRCNDPFWSLAPQGKSIAYLSPAELAMGMAIAYDWLYYDLTESERAAIRNALETKPFEITENQVKKYLTNEVNNRGQVHNAGIMATAIALYDKDKTFSSKWIENCKTGITTILPGIYGKTGSTQEGYGYWEYGTSFFALFDEMLLTVFGTDNGLSEYEGFKATGDYNLYMADHISPFAFSDGGRDNLSCQLSPWWLAAHFQRPDLLFTELYLHSIGRKVSDRIMPLLPFSLSKYPKLNLEGLSRPSSDVWYDSNDSASPVVLVRTGWTCTNSDKFLGLKGGYASVSHGHMDAGTFEYHANGLRWSIDNSVGGYALYTNKGLSSSAQTTISGYVKWLAMAYNSLGHSTISFANYNGSVSKTHKTDHLVASNYKATINKVSNTIHEKGGVVNMSLPLAGQVKSATRKAVIVDDSYLLVEDDIYALDGYDAQMIWRMVVPPATTVEIVGNSIKLTQGRSSMYVHPEFSGVVNGFKLRNWGDFDNAHPGLTKEWGWTSSDHKVTECIKAKVIGFTVTIPKGTEVKVSTTLTEYDPAAEKQEGVGTETPGFDNEDVYNW